LLLSGFASACGGDDEPVPASGPRAGATASPASTPAASATPEATATAPAPATVTPPVRTPTPRPGIGGGGEDQEGGAGDEEAIVETLRVLVDGEGVKPQVLRVAPSIPFKLIVKNDLPARLTVDFEGQNIAFVVDANSTYEQFVSGLPKGRYEYQVSHLDTGVIEVGS